MRSFILNGVKYGFDVIDTEVAESAVKPTEMENYNSATSPENFAKVEQQIKEEILNDRYKIVKTKPRIISALGAVNKSNGKVRIIHDASRPSGGAINDFWVKEKFQYQSIQDAVDLVRPGYWMAKVDLLSAFRSVSTHVSNHKFMGLKWTFSGDNEPTFLVDTRLPFGTRRSPYIFHQLGQAVRRMMIRMNHPEVVVFLDDFLVVNETYEGCLESLNVLMRLLRKLGFSLNYNKVSMPSQLITFLGIDLNSNNMTLSLPREKLRDLEETLRELQLREKVTKRELQSLVGRLNFACQCIYGGRFFLRRLNDTIARLRQPWHRTRVTTTIQGDIQWWLQFLSVFNGCMPMIDARPVTPIFTDACDVAAGAAYGQTLLHTRWDDWPETKDLHINHKEAMAVEVALAHWAPQLSNRKVLVYCDNKAAVGLINKCSCRNARVMGALRNIFWISTVFNFRLEVKYVRGGDNVLADLASRLHEKNIDAKHNVDLATFSIFSQVSCPNLSSRRDASETKPTQRTPVECTSAKDALTYVTANASGVSRYLLPVRRSANTRLTSHVIAPILQ